MPVFLRSLLTIWTLLIGAMAMSAPLLEQDFETALKDPWPTISAPWSVVADETRPGNHVLQSASDAGSRLTVGSPDWTDYEVRLRVRVLRSTADWLHIKIACRAATAERSLYLNLRNTGPVMVRQVGNQFTPLGEAGAFPIEPGVWYQVLLRCEGPVVSATVTNETKPTETGSARVYEEVLKAGPLRLEVGLGRGNFCVQFDDLVVTPVTASPLPQSRRQSVESRTLRVTLDEALGTLSFTDLRNDRTWSQTSRVGSLPQVDDVRVDGATLSYRLSLPGGAVRVAVTPEDHAEALVILTPESGELRQPMAYPPPVVPPSAEAEWVLPADEGVLIRADRTDMPRFTGTYTWSQGSLLMPWYGVLQRDAGLMMLVETPDDWDMTVSPMPTATGALAVAASRWLPSKGALNYPRRLRFCAFDQGGYVAMAKRYRTFLQQAGRFKTVAEKAAEVPAVGKLIGAIDIYDKSGPNDHTVLDWMIAQGIRRALYYGSENADKNRKAAEAGYVTAIYDIYTDIAGPELLAIWGPAKDPLDHRKNGYPQECVVTAQGAYKPGFAYPVGAAGGVDPAGRAGKRIPCYTRCSLTKAAWLQRIVPDQAQRLGLRSRFLDVETATTLAECYSDAHPATRTQDREARRALFTYLRSLGQVCASEGGSDFANDLLDYQEGSLTLNHFGGVAGVYVGTSPFRLPEDYIRSQFDPAIRVPLRELVYHDSTWVTWRWNHTPNRWEQREYWDDWDLLHLINAQMPIFILSARDLPSQAERVLKTYRDVCGFLEKVGGVEMTGHRFLTPDRTVQESRFANGWAVVVNFSADRAYHSPEGQEVPPRGFVTYQTQ